MVSWILEADKDIFLLFNGLHNSLLDPLMSWITATNTWLPFYLLLAIWLIYRYKYQGLLIILLILLVITATDQFTSSFMKPFFQRLRPCHEPALTGQVHVVGSCGGKFGFASSHAANTFGLVSVLFLLFRKTVKWIPYLFAWALIVSYSRIYVGVHYPGDVLAGALAGVLIACLLYYLYQMLPQKLRPAG